MARKAPAKQQLRPVTKQEREAIDRARETTRRLPVRPELAVEYSNSDAQTVNVNAVTDDEEYSLLVGEVFASQSVGFRLNALNTLINAARPFRKKVTSEGLNAALAFVAATEPANEVESTIAIQAYASHQMMLSMIELAKSADMVPQMVAYGNLANKFGRTFAVQIEALGKLKRGGEQIVKHIHVGPGGQAVVADEFHHHGGSKNESAGQSHATASAGRGAALPSPDSLGWGVPVPGRERQASMPDARRNQSGPSEGE